MAGGLLIPGDGDARPVPRRACWRKQRCGVALMLDVFGDPRTRHVQEWCAVVGVVGRGVGRRFHGPCLPVIHRLRVQVNGFGHHGGKQVGSPCGRNRVVREGTRVSR